MMQIDLLIFLANRSPHVAIKTALREKTALTIGH